MEKSSCFWGLLGGKKDGNRGTIDWPDLKKEKKEKKKKWSFIRSPKEKNKTMTISSPQHATGGNNDARLSFAISYNSESIEDQSRHAIAVAAATAAVAEAAVAAAQAAAAVVRLTSGSGRRASTYGVNIFKREEWAAVKIQSYFRGYLARRALRALKGLVRLQALVRGYIVRKGMAESLRCLRALISAQSMAQAGWTLAPESRQILSHTNYGPTTPGRYEQLTRGNSTRHEKSSPFKNAQAQPSLHRPIYEQGSTSRPSSRDGNILDRMQLPRNLSEQQLEELLWEHRRGTPEKTMYTDDEKGDKILEIDTGKPHSNPKRRHNFFNSCKHVPTTSDRNIHSVNTVGSPSGDSTTALLPARSLASGDIQSLRRFEYSLEVDDISLCTADNSPHNYSATSRPDSAKTRSDYSQNFFSRYLDSRSLLNEYSDYPNYMSNTESFRAKVRSHSAPRQRSYRVEKCSSTRRFSLQGSVDTGSQKASSVLEVNFKSKAYPGSGRLDRLAMAIDSDSVSLNGA